MSYFLQSKAFEFFFFFYLSDETDGVYASALYWYFAYRMAQAENTMTISYVESIAFYSTVNVDE